MDDKLLVILIAIAFTLATISVTNSIHRYQTEKAEVDARLRRFTRS